MQVPETRYARVGELRLAYQQWGEGPPVLMIPALVSNVEVWWEHELYRRSLEYFGKHMTCVCFDKRGIGLSDGFDGTPTLEQRNEDVLAVMDAVGWERAHILGVSEGAVMGQLFAADYPDRVESLILIGTFVSPRYQSRIPDYIQDGDPHSRRNHRSWNASSGWLPPGRKIRAIWSNGKCRARSETSPSRAGPAGSSASPRAQGTFFASSRASRPSTPETPPNGSRRARW